jgi:hypothetical protein
LFLVILPVSIYFFVYSATGNITAGFVAMVFAAFAWRMPAFASNWGKYPAIVGLSLFPTVVGLWIIYYRFSKKSLFVILLLIVTTVGLVSIHSRLVVCLVLVLISFLVSRKLHFIVDMNFWKAFLLTILSVVLFIPFRDYLSVYYENGYYLALALLALLLPIAFYRFPRLTITTMLFLMGVWGASSTRITFVEHVTALLDRPFVDILFSIPLSVLGGIGFASLLDRFQIPAFKRSVTILFLGVIIFSFMFAGSVYPDLCCNYVGGSDLEAISWVAENTSESAVIWISAFKPGVYRIATDAGAWIEALTGRNVNKLDFDFEWSSPDSLDTICRPGYEDVFVYTGSSTFSFPDEMLAKQNNWLAPVFVSGDKKIYQVTVQCDS